MSNLYKSAKIQKNPTKSRELSHKLTLVVMRLASNPIAGRYLSSVAVRYNQIDC